MKLKALLSALLIAALLCPAAMMEEVEPAVEVPAEAVEAMEPTEPAAEDAEEVAKQKATELAEDVPEEEKTIVIPDVDAVETEKTDDTIKEGIAIVDVDEVVAEEEQFSDLVENDVIINLDTEDELVTDDAMNGSTTYDEDIFDWYEDYAFWSFLKEKYDKNNSGGLSQRELDEIVTLDLTECFGRSEIKELSSISLLTNLKELNASGCTGLTRLAIFDLKSLEILNFSGCTNLVFFQLNDVATLKSLNFTGCTSLSGCNIEATYVENLILSGCTHFSLGYGIEGYYKFSGKTINNLDLSGCTGVNQLIFDNSTTVRTLNLSGCTGLTYFDPYNCTIENIDFSNCTNIDSLNLNNVGLKSLNVTGCTHLSRLNCTNNHLTQLDITGCTNLADMGCTQNDLSVLDITYCPLLISATSIPDYRVIDGIKGFNDLASQLYCDSNVTIIPEPSVDKIVVAIDAEHFPDDRFRDVVLSHYDPSGDGKLSTAEIFITTYLTVGTWEDKHTYIPAGATSLKGIEYFTSLEDLDFTSNQITSVDLSKNTNLIVLYCVDNKLTSLDLSKNTRLRWLECEKNSLTTLDISKCLSLRSIINNTNYHLSDDKKVVSFYVDDDYLEYCYLSCDNNVRFIGISNIAPAVEPAPVPAPAPAPAPATLTIPAVEKAGKTTISAAPGSVYQLDLGGAGGKAFKSSKKKVAVVNGAGQVTIRGAGKTKITFKVGKKKRTVTLTVKDPTIPTSVSLNPVNTAVKVGDAVTLTPVIPEGTNSGFKWKTSNKKVAKVVNGVVTFKKAGKVTITCTCARGKKKAKVTFRVSK